LHFGGEFGSPPCDFVEVAVVGFHPFAFLASVALAFVFSFAEGGEQRFPFFLGLPGKGVGEGAAPGRGRLAVGLVVAGPLHSLFYPIVLNASIEIYDTRGFLCGILLAGV